MRHAILQRKRLFVAVEGESEQSFVRWIQTLATEGNIAVHLDSFLLEGGGFQSMLENAVREQRRRSQSKGSYKSHHLIIDEDRARYGDWSVDKLRVEGARYNIQVCIQRPNHEGLLYRLTLGFEREIVSAASAQTKLKVRWPAYKKPMNAQKLQSHFSKDDLIRMARFDNDIATFLRSVGFVFPA